MLPALAYGELADVSREGYAFAGWWTAAEGGAEVTSASPLAVEAGHTLYAHWTEIITVTLDGNGGGTPSPESFNYSSAGTYGASLTAAAVTREGYSFAGWHTAAEGGDLVESGSAVTPWADHTLYAHWTLDAVETGAYFELTDDGKWVYVDAAIVGANLPGALQAAYGAWLTAEGRYDRLLLIVRGVVGDFRTAIAAELDPVGSLDSDLVLLGLLTPVKCAVWYNLALEMGYANAATFAAGWQDAQVYLRRLLVDLRQGTNLHGTSVAGSPLYGSPSRASSSSGSPGYDAGGSSSGGSGSSVPVNLSLGMG